MRLRDFKAKRRQSYLDDESYKATIDHIQRENGLNVAALGDDLTKRGRMTTLDLIASNKWTAFQLKYTAGERLTDLANSLDEIVLAYEQYVDANEEVPVLEELPKFFLPGRPELDEWLWDKPYRKLLDAIDSDTPSEMAKEMKQYVKSWYKDMKDVAHFCGKHEQINPEYTPYYGYWVMCAAALTYLYNIDDSSYRNETVYPKDLVDYARSIPRSDDTQQNMSKPLRVAGGEPCPKSGQWFAPAKADNQGHFSAGQIMPEFPEAPYGLTIWQWMGD